MTRKMKRPACRNCGRPLCKHTVTVRTSFDIAVGDRVAHPYDPDRVVVVKQIVRVREGAQIMGQRRTKDYSVWYGEFGRDGLGLFCGPTCGYRWAIRHAMDEGIYAGE